ncbi:MAG: hypothetical protein P4M04_06330 [Acidobacteriota bacterium]|nr:hypothetical protein [Acidobacteriota bacterium]
MRGKATGWAIFLLCLLGLSFAATTRYSKNADLLLICVRLALIVGLSILVVQERWTRSDPGASGRTGAASGSDGILQRFRRWYYDETKHPS